MRAFLPEPAVPRRRPRSEPGVDDVRFVPASWLVLALAASRLVFRGGRFAKLGLAGLAWSIVPRRLKLVVIGLAVAALIVVAGSLAAIALLALQLA